MSLTTDEETTRPLLTISEVAEFCRLSPRTVRRWIKRGELAAVSVAFSDPMAAEFVLGALGRDVSSRQVAGLLRSLEVPGRETPERIRQPWDPKKRRKQPPH